MKLDLKQYRLAYDSYPGRLSGLCVGIYFFLLVLKNFALTNTRDLTTGALIGQCIVPMVIALGYMVLTVCVKPRLAVIGGGFCLVAAVDAMVLGFGGVTWVAVVDLLLLLAFLAAEAVLVLGAYELPWVCERPWVVGAVPTVALVLHLIFNIVVPLVNAWDWAVLLRQLECAALLGMVSSFGFSLGWQK